MKKANTLRMTSLALAAMLVLGFAGLSQARGYSNGGPGYDAPLSQEQEAKAQQIFSNHYEKMDAVRQSLITKRAELDAQMLGFQYGCRHIAHAPFLAFALGWARRSSRRVRLNSHRPKMPPGRNSMTSTSTTE